MRADSPQKSEAGSIFKPRQVPPMPPRRVTTRDRRGLSLRHTLPLAGLSRHRAHSGTPAHRNPLNHQRCAMDRVSITVPDHGPWCLYPAPQRDCNWL